LGVQGFENPLFLPFASWTRGRREARGRRCQTRFLSLCSSTSHRPRPPVTDRCPAGTLESAPPCRDPEPAPHAAQPSPCPPWTPQPSLHATDRLPTHRLATDLTQYPLSNSLNQMPAIPAVHVAMASPSRCRRAAQRAQSALHVPVHQHTSSPCTSRMFPRHPEAVTMPLRPSHPVHHSLPTEHHFPHSFSETGAVSRDSTSHRHHLLVPWTQRIMLPRTAAHDGQSSLTRRMLDRAHPLQL
jgi:hypothetical protein